MMNNLLTSSNYRAFAEKNINVSVLYMLSMLFDIEFYLEDIIIYYSNN